MRFLNVVASLALVGASNSKGKSGGLRKSGDGTVTAEKPTLEERVEGKLAEDKKAREDRVKMYEDAFDTDFKNSLTFLKQEPQLLEELKDFYVKSNAVHLSVDALIDLPEGPKDTLSVAHLEEVTDSLHIASERLLNFGEYAMKKKAEAVEAAEKLAASLGKLEQGKKIPTEIIEAPKKFDALKIDELLRLQIVFLQIVPSTALTGAQRLFNDLGKVLEEKRKELEDAGEDDEVKKKAVKDAEKEIEKAASLLVRLKKIAKDFKMNMRKIVGHKSIGKLAAEAAGKWEFNLVIIGVAVAGALVLAGAIYFFVFRKN